MSDLFHVALTNIRVESIVLVKFLLTPEARIL
jgi:hypothetical protein